MVKNCWHVGQSGHFLHVSGVSVMKFLGTTLMAEARVANPKAAQNKCRDLVIEARCFVIKDATLDA